MKSDQNQPRQTYQMVKLLGEGSYGKAYLVKANSTNENCVIKTIGIERMDEKERQETLSEARILKKLDHPNIIHFKEVFMARKPRFTLNIVTEYADGGDLAQKIKSQNKKPFTENQILDWLTQICLAINHIHSKKIIHRDLKPQNIFLTKSGLIKLGDFGIAKCLECTWQKAMTAVGTPYYISPEIVQSKPYSFLSDIWSLGVILYEMMSLKVPFDACSLPVLSLKIMKGTYSPPPNNYSKELRTLLISLLQVTPEKRPPVKEILKSPIICNRIKNFLGEVEYDKDFSETFINAFIEEKKKPSNNNNNNINNKVKFNCPKLNKKEENNFKEKKRKVQSCDNLPVVQRPVDKIVQADNNKNNDFKRKASEGPSEVNNKSKEKKAPIKIIDNTSSTKTELGNAEPYEGFKDFIRQKKRELFNDENKPKNNQEYEGLLSKLQKKEANDGKTLKIPKIVLVKTKASDSALNSDNRGGKAGDKDTKSKEDQYNAHRYLRMISQLSRNQDVASNSHEDTSTADDSDEREENVIKDDDECTKFESTMMSDNEVNEIEQLRKELEKSLGYCLLQSIYRFVVSKTDAKVYKADFDEIKKLLGEHMAKLQYDYQTINKAIEVIPEVFSIVVKDRMISQQEKYI